MSNHNYVIKVSGPNGNPVRYSHTAQPKQRKARLKENIRASKGDLNSNKHAAWDIFKDVPYEDITFETFVSMGPAESAF